MAKPKLSNIQKYNASRATEVCIRGTKFSIDALFDFSDRIIDYLQKRLRTRSYQRLRRRYFLSASSIARIIKYKHKRSVHNRLDWWPLKTKDTLAGKQLESSIVAKLTSSFWNFHAYAGPVVHSAFPFLAATTDGILKSTSCETCQKLVASIAPKLATFRNDSILSTEQKIQKKLVIELFKNLCFDEKVLVEIKLVGRYLFRNNFNTNGELKTTGEFFCQIQYQMFVYNVKRCLLLIKLRHSNIFLKHMVPFSLEYIQTTLPLLQQFYMKFRLPYLFYSDYIKEKHQRKYKKKKILRQMGIDKQRRVNTTKAKRFHIVSQQDSDRIQAALLARHPQIFCSSLVSNNELAFSNHVNRDHFHIQDLAEEIDCSVQQQSFNFVDECKFGDLNDLLAFDFAQIAQQTVMENYFRPTGRTSGYFH